MRIIITGASRGFGRALALAFSRRGDKVLAVARDVTALAALQAECPSRIISLPLDLEAIDQVSKVIAKGCDMLGGIDVLVNNAASDRGVGSIWEVPKEEWHAVITINFLAHVEATSTVLPRMIAQRSGLIINVCSMAAFKPLPLLGAYCVSKAALLHYTRCLAAELQPYGVRANAVGIVADTQLYRSHRRQKVMWGSQYEKGEGSTLPLPEENVEPVLFLASPAGASVTGQYLECHSMTNATW